MVNLKTRRRQASNFDPQVRYKLASTVWKRLYKAKRSRYTGAAVSQPRTCLTAVTLAALLCLAAPAVILPPS